MLAPAGLRIGRGFFAFRNHRALCAFRIRNFCYPEPTARCPFWGGGLFLRFRPGTPVQVSRYPGMTELEMNWQIKTELRIAFQKLGGSPLVFQDAALEARTSDRIASEFAKQNAPFDLLCIIGSWGDTLSPDEVLHGLRTYNRNGITFSRVMCAVEPDTGGDERS